MNECNRQHEIQLEALHEVAQVLAQKSGQRKMLQDILNTLETRLAVSHATLMLVSSSENELIVEALGKGDHHTLHEKQYRRGEGIIGNVLKTGCAEIIPSISDEPRFKNRIHRRDKELNKYTSFICVHKANLRIIVATNKDLEEAVRLGQFRQDLYYRINVFPILIPPLRKRKSDILLLANEFVASFSNRMAKRIHRISTPAINMLTAYHWPGNVRELENCIEHAVLVSDDAVIHGRNLPPTLQVPDESIEAVPGTLKSCTAILENDMIVDALKRSRGNMSAAARELGITSRMVRYKIKNLKIDYNKRNS